MKEITWTKFFLAILSILVAYAILSLLTNAVVTTFSVGLTFRFFLKALLFIGVALVAINVFEIGNALGKWVAVSLALLIIVIASWGSVKASNPSAADSIERGANGRLQQFGDWINDSLFHNRQVNSEAEKTCDQITGDGKRAAIATVEQTWANSDKGLQATKAYLDDLKKTNKEWDDLAIKCPGRTSLSAPSSGADKTWFALPTSSSGTPAEVPVDKNGKFFVDATKAYGVTPAAKLRPGKLKIKSSGKAVWKNIPVGNPTKYEECGPDGTSPTASHKQTKAEYMSNIDSYLCPTALKGALIAKIGDGSWFPVGSKYEEDINSTERITFAINDLDPQTNPLENWNDNDKGYDVVMTIH